MASILLLTKRANSSELLEISNSIKAEQFQTKISNVLALSLEDGNNPINLDPLLSNKINELSEAESCIAINFDSYANHQELLTDLDSILAESTSNTLITVSEVELSEPSDLISFVAHETYTQVRMLKTSREKIGKIKTLSQLTLDLLIPSLIVQEISERSSISAISSRSLEVSRKISGTSENSAKLLSQIVNSNNIEDLFPDHNWTSHQEESAAACYHTLAAQFIRFGDLESALECLSFSDQLEDSPRSLALKGLISLNRGETLGAVANLVSSLQQYETRKRNTENKHYLTFIPEDLEVVNNCLNRGLEALNTRDNKKAVNYFADAICNFDKFYSENQINKLLNC